ncbi:MAG: DUF6263 family protein, partial [Bacteroidia bacterium]
MKKLLFFSSALSIMLLFSCSNNESKKENSGKIKLVFHPVPGQKVKMNYSFSVTQMTSGDVTGFNILMSGKADTTANGMVTLEMKNDNIEMNGTFQGKPVHGSATGSDTLTGDAKLVALPVFALAGKTYRSIYSKLLDRQTEVQIDENGAIIDSTEDKDQLLLRFSPHEVAVGDTWDKEIIIKTGNKMNCNAKYTLKEIKGDTATIAIAGTLSGDGEKFGNAFSIEGKITGTFTVDIKTGWAL